MLVFPTSQGFESNLTISSNESIIVDCSQLNDISHEFIDSMIRYSSNISEFRVSGSKLNENCIDSLFEYLFPSLRSMERLNISHTPLSFKSQHFLCQMMNPLIFGYCPILQLNISRTCLGYKGSVQLFEAITGNITIKELYINGNSISDDSIPYLVKFLRNPDNILEVLGISHNNITTQGIKILSTVIGIHKHLKELYLDGNPILSSGANFLLSLIWKTKLKTLSMSNCQITSCEWISPLIYMTDLESLSLSHNNIDGFSVQTLSDTIQKCACLRHLNISHNNLNTIQAGCIGQLIKIHKGLISINLAGNNLPNEVISALILGIYGNCTLRTLNLAWCNLSIDNASLLCNALAENSLLELNLDFNPIPDDMRINPRKSTIYLKRREVIESHRQQLETDGKNRLTIDSLVKAILKTSIVTSSTGGAVAEEEEHIEFAFVDPLSAEIAAEIWRQEKLSKILQSQTAYSNILSLRQQEINENITDEQTEEEFLIKQQNKDNELKLHIDPGAAAEKAKKQLLTSQSTLIDIHEGKFILSVSYGRRSEVIGTIEVTEKMTYFETRELIKPLLKIYFESSEEHFLTNVYHFKLLDGLGFVLTEEAEKVRIAWAELSTAGHCLHIQPADWLYIPKEEE